MISKEYTIKKDQKVHFENHVDFCIGTGRMGLALQKEYLDQLALTQEYIGFQHIRGHGLFSDDMAIYHEYEDENGQTQVEYNYTYLDLVMDSYLKLNIKPFIELGFMPKKLASGEQTIFYWKGNTTPPKDYKLWNDMVQSLLRHLMERYGTDEVVTWPIEVWNEPNLWGFWKGADKQEYFKLFKNSFYAIKEVDSRFRVGGPAVCGGSDEEWIRAFLDYCHEEKIPVDFITRHHYTTDFPEDVGHYGYAKLTEPQYGFDNLKTTRDIIESFEEYKGLEIHITEFNSSYIPTCPLHDTNQNAAYIAHQLANLGDYANSYSYWTFGDIFEERGVPYTPFHGGFGLIANGGIPKPTFWSFVFFKQLQGECVHRSNDSVIVKKEDGSYYGIAYHYTLERKNEVLDLNFQLPATKADHKYFCTVKTVDEKGANPLRAWHEMGEPANLNADQLALLKQVAQPVVTTQLIEVKEEQVQFHVALDENAVIAFEIRPIQIRSDRGYDYERVMKENQGFTK